MSRPGRSPGRPRCAPGWSPDGGCLRTRCAGRLYHALDIGLAQLGAGGDDDLLFVAGGLVFGRGVQDAVGIQVECDLDLRRPRGAGGRPSSRNLPSVMLSAAIGRSPCSTRMSTPVWASAAVLNTSLLRVGIVALRGMSVVITPPIVRRRAKAASRRAARHPSSRRSRHRPGWPSAHRHYFVRVDRLIRLLAAGQLAHELLHHRHAGRAADEHQFVQVLWRALGVEQGGLERLAATLN